jgi:hypothetical protein
MLYFRHVSSRVLRLANCSLDPWLATWQLTFINSWLLGLSLLCAVAEHCQYNCLDPLRSTRFLLVFLPNELSLIGPFLEESSSAVCKQCNEVYPDLAMVTTWELWCTSKPLGGREVNRRVNSSASILRGSSQVSRYAIIWWMYLATWIIRLRPSRTL